MMKDTNMTIIETEEKLGAAPGDVNNAVLSMTDAECDDFIIFFYSLKTQYSQEPVFAEQGLQEKEQLL